MEKKNTNVRRELIKSVGFNLMLLSLGIPIVYFLMLAGAGLFSLYFIGLPAAFVEPFQDVTYLVVLIAVIFTLFIFLSAIWSNISRLYGTFTRYRTMRQEKARIERLMNHELAQDSQHGALLQYTEVEPYEEIASGKR